MTTWEWKHTFHIEEDIMYFLKEVEHRNVELVHGHYETIFKYKKWIKKIQKYITNYINTNRNIL